ncbi:unnamed protein product, partial [Prorocentrum cordatum]
PETWILNVRPSVVPPVPGVLRRCSGPRRPRASSQPFGHNARPSFLPLLPPLPRPRMPAMCAERAADCSWHVAYDGSKGGGEESPDKPWLGAWDETYSGGLHGGGWQDDASWKYWMAEAQALKEVSSMLPKPMLDNLRARASESYFDFWSTHSFPLPPTRLSLLTRGAAAAPRFVSSSAPGLGPAATDAQQRKVFVGGVPQDYDDLDLMERFTEWGAVQTAWLQRFRKNAATKNGTKHSHRGFGFVVFVSPDSIYSLLGFSSNR